MPIAKKIVFDDKTKEPIIVDVPADKTINGNAEQETEVSRKAVRKAERQHDKQIVMSQVFGVDTGKSTDARARKLKNICAITFIVLVVAVLVWTAYNDFFSPEAQETPVTWSAIVATISSCWYYLLFALIALLMCFVAKGLKLSVMCKSMTGKFRFGTCFETGIIGHYYNNVTPLAAGGQPFEIYHLSKHGVHGGVASSMPIAAYVMYQFAFVLMGLFCLITFNPGINVFGVNADIVNSATATVCRTLAAIGLIFGLLMPAIVLLFCVLPRLGSKIIYFVMFLGEKLRVVKNRKVLTYKTTKTVIHNSRCLKRMATSPITFVLVFLISIAEICALCSIAYFSLRFFGYDNPEENGMTEWLQIVQICMVLYSAISFIPTPGNSGAADLSFYWLFKSGLAASIGLAFPAMITWRLLSYYSFIIIGFAFTKLKRKSDRRKERTGKPLYRE